MIDYWQSSSRKLMTALTQHLELVAWTMLIAILVAGIVVLMARRFPKIRHFLVYLLSAIYAIPSLALFTLLIPLTGLGRNSAMIVLVTYAQYILVRSFLASLDEVDKAVLEAGRGMGMTSRQLFWQIELPLASPGLLAGIKLATTSTIGIATIAAAINAGGLGTILFDGMRTQSLVKLGWGSLLTIGLCLLVNIILGGIERYLAKKFDTRKAQA